LETADKLDDAQQETLNRLVKAVLAENLGKFFGRAYKLRVKKTEDGHLHIQAVHEDSGNDYMTVHDLAALLQTDVATVRRMTKERAQRQARFPLPFFKINGKMLRFDRKKIQECLQNMTAATPVFKPAKQRGRRVSMPRSISRSTNNFSTPPTSSLPVGRRLFNVEQGLRPFAPVARHTT